MKKEIKLSVKGKRADLGPLMINRILPNQSVNKVGPFVFLDYVAPAIKETINKNGMGAHPHRGIATLTYILQGEVEHFDSAGHTGKIHSGGAQWMKAGNGIVHDENFNFDSQTPNKFIEGFQFWINLPAKNKAEAPAHLAIQAEDIPKIKLNANDGWIKVITGNYGDLNSIIPNYSEQFLYHIHLEPGRQFSINLADKIEVAAFLPSNKVTLNDTQYQANEFVVFDTISGIIEVINTSEKAIDVIFFGGEEYTEAVVAEGPFVMNSLAEITTAYRDFYAGKYGAIRYN